MPYFSLTIKLTKVKLISVSLIPFSLVELETNSIGRSGTQKLIQDDYQPEYYWLGFLDSHCFS